MKIKFYEKSHPIDNNLGEALKKRRWDRWIYLGILIFLLVSFFSWLLTPWFFHSAQGNLLQQQYDVQFAHDIRVFEYKVEEGQQVKIGDTLFTYERFGERNNTTTYVQDSLQLNLKQEGERASLLALESQIEKRRLFSMDLQKRLNHWNEERDRKEKLVYLNVIAASELATIDRTIDDISYQMATVKTEYQVLQKQKEQLQKSLNKHFALGYLGMGLTHQTAAFLSPVAGKIDRLRIPMQHICYKGDKVTSIIHPDYFVRAYVEVSDLANLEVGDEVIVMLPYGNEKLAGKINKMYAISELKDDIVYEKSINTRKYGVVIEILPSNKKGWDKLKVSNIPVKVRKGRINL